PGVEQPVELQYACYDYLRGMLAEIVADHAQADEEMSIEIWMRNPQKRQLFLWASSDGYWRPSETAPIASLQVRGDVTQTTFREGRTLRQKLLAGELGRWRYHISTPLVLPDEPPWYRLPVGVLNVMSTKDNGGLAVLGAELEPFENRRNE